MALWAVVVLFTALIILSAVLVVLLFRLGQVQKYEQGLRHAWIDQGICAGENPVCRISERDDLELTPGPFPAAYSKMLSRQCLDYLVRLTKPTEGGNDKIAKPVSTPMHHEQLHLFDAIEGGPYFAVAYKYQGTLVFAFRCTVTPYDIEMDMQLQQVSFQNRADVLLHKGFNTIYEHYRPTIHKIIERYNPTSILITGHSLGGAIASVATVDLALWGRVSHIGTYVFGSPRVGNLAFCQIVETHPNIDTFWENTNEADLITDLPASVMPDFSDPKGALYYYYHANRGRHEFLSNWGALKRNHFLAVYIADAESA